MISYDSESDDSDLEQLLSARKKRRFQDRPCFFEIYDENEFSRRFRISKEGFQELLAKIRHKISPVSKRYEYF